jgi:hypothetical protein
MYRTCVIVSLAVIGCGKTESAADELRRLAAGVKGHVTSLSRFHKDILPKEKKADEILIWMKAGVDACMASREETEKLSKLYFDPPLGEQKLKGEVLTGAAASHLQALDFNCKESEMRDGDMAKLSSCHLACAKSWTSFAQSVELIQKQAKEHGVELASLVP